MDLLIKYLPSPLLSLSYYVLLLLLLIMIMMMMMMPGVCLPNLRVPSGFPSPLAAPLLWESTPRRIAARSKEAGEAVRLEVGETVLFNRRGGSSF